MMKCTIIPQDIPQKMAESIFKYRGHPYYVRSVDKTTIALFEVTDPGGVIVSTIKYNDDQLDFSSISLGYVNMDPYKSVVYLTRAPIRKVKQGVNSQNTRCHPLPGTKPKYTPQNCLHHRAFIELVVGKYPSLEEAMQRLRAKNGVGEIAISSSIALAIDELGLIKVYYKNQYVGWIEPNKFLVHVKNDELGWVVSKFLSHILGWQID